MKAMDFSRIAGDQHRPQVPQHSVAPVWAGQTMPSATMFRSGWRPMVTARIGPGASEEKRTAQRSANTMLSVWMTSPMSLSSGQAV